MMVAFKLDLFSRFDIKHTDGQSTPALSESRKISSTEAGEAYDEPPPYASTTNGRVSLHEISTTAPKEDKARPKASKRLFKGKCRIVPLPCAPLPYVPVAIRERIEASASTAPQGPE
jgi:hypothetical protein